MRDMVEVDRLWIVILATLIAFGLLIETIFGIILLVVDSSSEFLPFILFICIALLQGGAIGYLIAFYIISRKFLKYDRLIIKSKQGIEYFTRNLGQEIKIPISNED